MSACRRYHGRSDGTDWLIPAPSSSAFPRLQLGRLLHYQFRGLLSVHSRYNLQTRQVALCDPLHRRLRRLCYLHRRSDCYRVERSSSRAGLSSRCGPAPFTAHRYRLITAVTGDDFDLLQKLLSRRSSVIWDVGEEMTRFGVLGGVLNHENGGRSRHVNTRFVIGNDTCQRTARPERSRRSQARGQRSPTGTRTASSIAR
jgi:hypothetical protein